MGPRSAISQASSRSLRALSGPVRGAGEAAQPGAGEEAAGEEFAVAGAAEAGYGVVDFRGCGREAGLTCWGRWRRLLSAAARFENRRVERGAAQGEVVEGDVEEAELRIG